MQAINCLADRLDGKPPQAVEMSNETPRYVIHAPEPCRTVEEWEAEVRADKFRTPQLAPNRTEGENDSG